MNSPEGFQGPTHVSGSCFQLLLFKGLQEDFLKFEILIFISNDVETYTNYMQVIIHVEVLKNSAEFW